MVGDKKMKKFYKTSVKCAVAFAMSSMVFGALATDVNSVTTGRNTNGDYEIQIGGRDFRGVKTLSLDNPARIVIDIPDARSHLAEKVTKVTHPLISEVTVIEGDDRTRAVVALAKPLPYDVVEKSNRITVVVKEHFPIAGVGKNKSVSGKGGASRVNFERSDSGAGKIKIQLPSPKAVVDVQRRGKKIIATLRGGHFSRTKRLNVTDFGTPVKSVDIFRNQLSVSTVGDDYELLSYQNDGIYSMEFTPINKDKDLKGDLPPGDPRKKYTGEPLSLNFQDVEVRAVLQIIGEFTKTNIVVHGSVQGNITLRLNDVPWDQALDTILQIQGLSQRKNGNIIFIAPSAVMAANMESRYKVANVEKQVAPLEQELIPIQYARAQDLERIIEDNSNEDKGRAGGLLSSRGEISVDSRTNVLIVNDVPSSISKVRSLVAKLDVAVKQVLIDARVVTASNNFAHELGVDFRLGGTKMINGNSVAGGFNSMGGRVRRDNDSLIGEPLNYRLGEPASGPIDGSPTMGFGLSFLSAGYFVDMELAAMQADGRGEIISSPRVVAQDGGSASIKAGTQIAYVVTDKNGTATTTWKDAALKLDVKPKIAPNNQIDMDLLVTKNAVGAATSNGEPSIATNEIKTQVLVGNGETVVLGGVYEQTKRKAVRKVPVLGDLPILGVMFRKDSNSVERSELLIFVTPRIINERYVSKDRFSALRK